MAERRSNNTSKTPARKKRSGTNNQTRSKKTKVPNKTLLLTCGIIGLVLLAFLAISAISMYAGNRNVAKNGVTVLGIDVGGKSEAEISQLLESQVPFSDFSATFTCGENSKTITAKDVNLRLDTKKTAAAAVAYGRKNIFSAFTSLFTSKTIEPVYTYDHTALSDISVAFSTECGGNLKQHSVSVEDTKSLSKQAPPVRALI